MIRPDRLPIPSEQESALERDIPIVGSKGAAVCVRRNGITPTAAVSRLSAMANIAIARDDEQRVNARADSCPHGKWP